MTLRSLTLSRCDFELPSADVSCGDGVFSFLHAGGELDPAFDVFGAVANLDRVKDQHADMFDAEDAGYAPTILGEPAWHIDVGADVKKSMLQKADALNFYRRLVEHDNNIPLPFDDDTFTTVYCNSAYWVRNIDSFLAELGRITRPDGRVILQVKLAAMADYTLERHRNKLGHRFLDIIGRGRLQTWPTVATRSQWEPRFKQAGLAIAEATPFVTRTHAHIWDIGLRPIAPLLIRMACNLTAKARREIKEEWVDLFLELLDPICDPSFDLFENDAQPAEIQYILTPT